MWQFVPGLDLPVPVLADPLAGRESFIYLLACLIICALLRQCPPG